MISNILQIFFYFLLIYLCIEIFFNLIIKLKDFILYNKKSRKEFLNREYHKYVDRFESNVPLFKYLPVGMRLFNDEDKISGVENNTFGFRSSEFTKKEKSVIRIVLLGGSVAYGCGATSNDKTISGHLENILKKKFGLNPKIECFNLAQINNFLSQDLLIANTFFLKLKPDYVISLAGWNEIAAFYLQNKEKVKKFRTYLLEEVGELGPMNLPSYRKKIFIDIIKKFIRNNFRILSYFTKQNNKKKYEPQLGSDPKDVFDQKKFLEEVNLSSDIFIEHMKKFYFMSKGYGFEYIQFLQPHIYKKKNLTEEEKKIIKLYDYVRPAYGGEAFSEYLKNNNIYDLINKKLENNKICELYNFENIFENELENIFYTLVHLNDKGYESLAIKISDILAKKIESKLL
jgi:lysophospholipase L1-like esterase